MVQVQKWLFFQLFLLRKIGQKNVLQDILERKNAFLDYKNNKFKKSNKLTFFRRGNPWFWCKNGHFSNFFFQAKQARKMCFTIFQNEKTPFQAIKPRRSKSRRIDIFPKGLTTWVNPWFWCKNGHFSNFFFQAIQARKMCFKIFQNEKTLFQTIKTTSSKSRKIDIFPKGLSHGFGAKMAIFPTFSFRRYRPGKCVLRYSRTKKRLSRL